MILVDATDLAMSRPGKPLFTDLSITVSTGHRLGVVGINGCGKSTLLNVLAGIAAPEAGIVHRGRGVTIAALPQVPVLDPGSVIEAVAPVADERWEAEAVLDRLGMGDLMDTDTATLSGGQAKRVALARTLVVPSDLLILDEPTNHLDIDAIAWLEDRLASHRGALVIVTHDRHLLDRVTNRILELDRGRGYQHEGGYDAYLEGRAKREEQAASAEASRKNLARKELAWLRRGAPARTRKPKARIAEATRVVESRADAADREGIPALHFGTPRLGDKVIELHDVSFGYPDRSPLFSGVDLRIDNRERLGIVGANGTGKSTLLDVMAGRKTPVTGTVDTGVTVQLGYYDQTGVQLDLDQRVREAVAGDTRDPDWRDAALLDSFWFGDDAQWAPIRLLSGGERRRLQLLLVLARKPNVLLLDEPTNDLDLDTLRLLEEFLDEWPGALLVVSHDRAFLERTVTDVIVLDGEGSAKRRPGGYAAWEAERRAGGSPSGRAAAPTKRRPSKPPAATSETPAVARSASTLRQLMRETEKELARLERRRKRIEDDLVAAGTDHQRLAALGTDLAEVTEAIESVEERWLDLASEGERR